MKAVTMLMGFGRWHGDVSSVIVESSAMTTIMFAGSLEE